MFSFYKKWFASRLAEDPSSRDPLIISHKNSLFNTLRGNVLEIGPGTGVNFKYFPNDIQWVGIEPNVFTKQYLQREAETYGFLQRKLISGTVERLPFPPKTFDSIVSTHVLCSVRDVHQSLGEIHRVLKQKGTFYFLEHQRSKNRLKKIIQHGVTPMWTILADGCHPNRDIETEIQRIPFKRIELQRFTATLPVIGEHIVGKAVK